MISPSFFLSLSLCNPKKPLKNCTNTTYLISTCLLRNLFEYESEDRSLNYIAIDPHTKSNGERTQINKNPSSQEVTCEFEGDYEDEPHDR